MQGYNGKPTPKRKKNIARMIEARALKASESKTKRISSLSLSLAVAKLLYIYMAFDRVAKFTD